MLYESLDELISLAYNALQNIPDADMGFIESVQFQYQEKGSISPKQIQALENIAYKELNKRREMENNLTLF